MVMRRRWSEALGITLCSMSRATKESHWTLPSGDSLLRIAPAAAMATINTPTMQNVPSLLAILMVIAMQWYYTARIAWWRRFVAFIKATKHRHRASTRSDSIQSDTPMPVDSYISLWKRASDDMFAPNKNRGVTYQTDGNHLSKSMGYSVGEVQLACYYLNTRLLLCVFTNNHRKYLSNRTSKKLLKCYVYEVFSHLHCTFLIIFGAGSCLMPTDVLHPNMQSYGE